MVLGGGGEKMSKSRGNVISPDDVIKEHGADTLRIYEMFMGPFDQAIPWDTKGVVGVRRFLDKVWNVYNSDIEVVDEIDNELEILLNQTIKKVSDDIESMGFNTAVSSLMILTNKILETRKINKEIQEKLLILLSPFAPHITEELWKQLGNKKSIGQEKWPTADESKLKDELVDIVVQINGKVRAKLKLSPDVSEAEAVKMAKSDPNVKKHLEGKKIKKTIFVSGRLISFVI
jgi:leucyl-tRNA synthetase